MRRARASGPTCARASAKRKRTRRPVHNGTIRGDQPLRQHEPSTDVRARWPLPAVWRRCERADSRSAVQRDPARRGATAAERILCRLRCAADRQPLRGTAPHDPRTVGLRTHDGRGSIERPRAACGALGFTLRPSRVREETPFRPGTPVPRVAPPVDAQGIPCDVGYQPGSTHQPRVLPPIGLPKHKTCQRRRYRACIPRSGDRCAAFPTTAETRGRIARGNRSMTL